MLWTLVSGPGRRVLRGNRTSSGVDRVRRALRPSRQPLEPEDAAFIYGKRNLIHIIDLRETVRGLLRAYRYLAKVASRNSLVLFVGTKRQAKESIEREPGVRHAYVNERWLGGT